MKQIQDALSRGPNVLLTGPPGTGKTVALEDIVSLYSSDFLFDPDLWDDAWGYTNGGRRAVSLVFHPSYSYENFVASLVPAPATSGVGGVSLKAQPGPLLSMAHWCGSPGREGLVVIDEFNRAPTASVFGDTLALLDGEKRTGGPSGGARITRAFPDEHMHVDPDYADASGNTAIPKQIGLPRSLAIVAEHIECDDALSVHWRDRKPFDALLMNPPWESLRQERSDPAMARARENSLRRLEMREALDPVLPPLFSAQGRGDRNLAKMFIELAPHLLLSGGRIGAVLPAAFGSDDGMADLRSLLFEHIALDRWTTFENIKRHFNIDSRYKFGLLTGTRSEVGTKSLEVRAFCSDPKEVNDEHVLLDSFHIAHIGGPDRMIPEVVSRPERDTIGRALSHGVPFFEGGALGRVKYRREVDLTLGRSRATCKPVSEVS